MVENPQEPVPIEMAKLLKSQDENYIRTIRSLNLKVLYMWSLHGSTGLTSEAVENRGRQKRTQDIGQPSAV